MRGDKAQAIALRLRYKSYNEISKALGIPKGTLSGWFAREGVSQKIKKDLTKRALVKTLERVDKLVAANKMRWEAWRRQARQEAVREFPLVCHNPLFIAGLMLYWAEGDSNPKNPVKITNTDPRMIRLYVKFLTKILRIKKEKIHPGLILYPDLSNEICLDFWSKAIKIPVSQFYKTQVIKGRHPTARLAHGICMVTYSSRQLKEKFLLWIDMLSKRLYTNNY